MGSTSMEEMWGTGFAAVNVDVGPERRSESES